MGSHYILTMVITFEPNNCKSCSSKVVLDYFMRQASVHLTHFVVVVKVSDYISYTIIHTQCGSNIVSQCERILKAKYHHTVCVLAHIVVGVSHAAIINNIFSLYKIGIL